MVEARLGVGRKGREMQAKEVKAEPENMYDESYFIALQTGGQIRLPSLDSTRFPNAYFVFRSGKAEWKEGELLPEGWDEMDTGKKIIEGLYGKRGFVYWLNWLSFRFIFVLLGGWIVFRFVGPAINAYQLTNDFSASDIQPL